MIIGRWLPAVFFLVLFLINELICILFILKKRVYIFRFECRCAREDPLEPQHAECATPGVPAGRAARECTAS